ncbi:serine aminopeptidase domain-containing protein [Actinomyces wuliandei]|uniref:serine aminopeptidase domain-containing protein n=1 Tax=Actinomyces wuliandei TaxID=2057743 RepID=UPI001FAAE2F0|nr:alpha/beta hydrolase [Actinomyces wuliandei]
MGPGFQARTLELAPDAEDDGAVATLVHHVPSEDPHALPGTPTAPVFAYLYVHGWNDYFFQTHLAREVSALGGAFYALDLRRYGRSWREGQMHGWCASLLDYDEELDLALRVIRSEHASHPGPGLPLVLNGHSTGGLTAALWAHRHPGVLSGLALTSPWLETWGGQPARTLGRPVIRTLTRVSPRMELPTGTISPSDVFYVADGWDDERDGALPDPSWAQDPYVTGWDLNPAWVLRPWAPVRPGWLLAVLDGQARVAQGLAIDCPVLSMASARSLLTLGWAPQARHADTIIDAQACARRSVQLGNLVTIARFAGGVHDLTLSEPPVRGQVFSTLGRWLMSYALRAPQPSP